LSLIFDLVTFGASFPSGFRRFGANLNPNALKINQFLFTKVVKKVFPFPMNIESQNAARNVQEKSKPTDLE